MSANQKSLSPTSALSNTLSTSSQHQQLYQPLSSWQTRLIKLLSGQHDAPLRCELHVAAITIEEGLGITGEPRGVSYDALSYSWGRPDLNASIECNGIPTPVPPSMADGLRQLRLHEEARWVWCDALCINQRDINEKSAQVRQMLLIFVKARKVIAWLGESDPSIQKMVEVITTLTQASGLSNSEYDRRETLRNVGAEIVRNVMKQLLKRPWFSRTWVRQEVFAARNLDLQIGRYSLSFAYLVGLAELTETVTAQLNSLASNYTGRVDTAKADVRDGFDGLPSVTARAFRVLCDNLHFGVSDPRDRVYALVGMIDNLTSYNLAVNQPGQRQGQKFPIDYSSTVSMASQALVKFLISADGNLSSLDVLGERSFGDDLPSWAIDWGSQALCCTREAYSIPRFFGYVLPNFNCGFATPDERRQSPSFRTTPDIGPDHDLGRLNELHLVGYRLGVIRPSSSDGWIPNSWQFDSEQRAIWGGHLQELTPFDNFHETSRMRINSLLEEGVLTIKTFGELRDPDLSRQQSNGRVEATLGVVVSSKVRTGDLVVQLLGSKMMHVLRALGDSNNFILVSAGWFWRATRDREMFTARTDPKHPQMLFYCDIGEFGRTLAGPGTDWSRWFYKEFETAERRATLTPPEFHMYHEALDAEKFILV